MRDYCLAQLVASEFHSGALTEAGEVLWLLRAQLVLIGA